VDLAGLNAADRESARAELLLCCASTAWVDAMVARRPYADPESLLQVAETVWWSLSTSDWLEAFAAHPRLGDGLVGTNTRWSRMEQAAAASAAAAVLSALTECNRAYEDRFGHVFLMSAMGKTADEMLESCRERLHNKPDTESSVAAGEQAKITDLRLRRLLGIV
jgi:OHCU decarboxylase